MKKYLYKNISFIYIGIFFLLLKIINIKNYFEIN